MTAIAQALSAALLEFVWQGLLIAFLLWTSLFILKNRSARARYLASCVALALMAMLPVVTACLLYTAPAGPQAPIRWGGAVPQTIHAAMSRPAVFSLVWAANWAVPVWSLGVLLFALRLVWASRQISGLRRRAEPADAAVLAVISGLRQRMNLVRPVRVLISALADCPSVIGWIRPVVLLPAATVLGLTPPQLEAVLAHELAHILRYDYLVNMLQTVVETLLFYHPAVWWASARIRQERELCCDDVAVYSCGDALCYARALTRLERLRVTVPRLALSSAGGPLLYRIQRLAGDAGWQRGPSKLPGILALSLGLLCLTLNLQWARGQQPGTPAPEPGVHVDLGGAAIIHQDEVEYPDGAIEKGIQGTVEVEATLDAAGEVSDARVLSGPPELRKAALQSVLGWRFAQDAAGGTRQIGIAFQLPAGGSPKERAEALVAPQRHHHLARALVQKQLAENMAKQARILQSQQSANASEMQTESKELAEMMEQLQAGVSHSQFDAQAEVLQRQLQALESQAAALDTQKKLAELQARLGGSAMFAGRRLKIIDVQGLSNDMRDVLVAKLPVHLGDILAEDSMEKIEAVLKQFDEHLGLSMRSTGDGQVEIRINVSPAPHY